jgi:hypothetical protein
MAKSALPAKSKAAVRFSEPLRALVYGEQGQTSGCAAGI